MEGDGHADRDAVAGIREAPTAIAVEALSKEQLVRLADHFELVHRTVVASNNELLARLSRNPELTPGIAATLNEWALAMNALFAASALEIEKIAATIN